MREEMKKKAQKRKEVKGMDAMSPRLATAVDQQPHNISTAELCRYNSSHSLDVLCSTPSRYIDAAHEGLQMARMRRGTNTHTHTHTQTQTHRGNTAVDFLAPCAGTNGHTYTHATI